MKILFVMLTVILLATGSAFGAEPGEQARIEALEQKVEALLREIEGLKKAQVEAAASATEKKDAGQAAVSPEPAKKSTLDRFSFGGYGEVHANLVEGAKGDKLDIHRLVAYVGYEFADWIKLQSEIELEHAFVSKGSGGELNIEQLYTDFLLNRYANIRAGRVLAPLGITNQRHEPTAVFGVERPSFDKVVIPTTWSLDGIGLFGSLMDNLNYQVYAVAGLDGSQFNAADGIRKGRIKETPSLNDMAVAGRVDYYPLLNTDLSLGQDLRLGLSGYYGGYQNGNDGKNPGVDGSVSIFSGDFETSINKLDLRGAAAVVNISNPEHLPGKGVAESILGWYLEAGYHFWPEAFRQGRLERSDAVIFARYDDYDTQFRMPAGVAKDPASDRSEWTFGLNFYPVPNFVAKVDYQLRDSAAAAKPNNLVNLGIGWQF